MKDLRIILLRDGAYGVLGGRCMKLKDIVIPICAIYVVAVLVILVVFR